MEEPLPPNSKGRKRQRQGDNQNPKVIQDDIEEGQSDDGPVFSWTPSAVLAPLCPGGSASVSSSVCRLFAEGNSVPFIARYRRPQTGGMTPDDLRCDSMHK